MKVAPFLAIAALLGLSACEVPSLEQRKVLDSMVGKNEVDVVRQFGVPSRSFQTQGHSFLAYIQNATEYTGGGGPNFVSKTIINFFNVRLHHLLLQTIYLLVDLKI